MHLSPDSAAQSLCKHLLGFGLALVVGFSGAVAWSQNSLIEVDKVGSRTQRLLDQVDALAEDGQWADAIETLTLVMQQEQDRMVPAGPQRYLPLAFACQARLVRLPDKALDDYRSRIDPSAAQLMEEARENRDPAPVERVLQEYFVSRHTPQAILLLADLAIERGDYAAARRALQRLAPELTDPIGRPIGIALRGIDLDQHWEQLIALLRQPSDSLPPCCSDPNDALPAALARLAMMSLHEHDLDRAAIEIHVLRHLAPDSQGRIAGSKSDFVPMLEGMLKEAEQWSAGRLPSAASTFAATADRAGVAAPVGELVGSQWHTLLDLTPVQQSFRQPRQTLRVLPGGIRVFSNTAEMLEPEPVARSYPCIYGPWVGVRHKNKLLAVELATGEPAIAARGVLDEGNPIPPRPQGLNAFGGIRAFPGALGGRLLRFASLPEGPLEIAHGVLYARLPPELNNRAAPRNKRPSRIVGLDLNSDGLEVVKFKQPDNPWHFSGPPLVEDGLAFVALAADEVRPRVAIACYSTRTGEPLWTTPVCSGPPPGDYSQQRPAEVLTKSGDRLYLNTNLGAVAAVDSADGHLCWVAEYPRLEETASTNLLPDSQGVSPCIAHRGRVLVAPVDSSEVFALDSATGVLLWTTNLQEQDAKLLGAKGRVLVIGSRRLTGLDIDTGRPVYQWPESPRAGIRGMGRGCLAGDEVFWPTRDRVYIMNTATGAPSRPPLPLGPVAGAGANLAVAHGLLVAAGADKMTVFGPYPVEPSAESREEVENPGRNTSGGPLDATVDIDAIIQF